MHKPLLAFVVGGMMLSACTSLQGETKQSKKAETIDNKVLGLPAQDLVEGECGAFLWADTNPRQFVYFQKQNAAHAEFYNDGRARSISAKDATSYLVDKGSLSLNYTDTDGATIAVKGVFGGEMDGGYRLKPATITVNSTDGWQQIIPASGVFVCR